MISLSSVRLRRGPQVLLDGATVSIFRGDKVGIVGRNGCGKSTLLALIRGELSPDAGDYTAPPKLAIASVLQELPDSDSPLVEYVLDGDVELRAVERAIAAAEAAGDGTRQAALHAEFDHLGGYAARSRAASLAAGLGFAPDDIDKPIRQFSGGLKMRANLARTLMRRSDLLLLDEPTNHLDLDAVLWLENWLRGYAGTLLLVSHDREFLDAIVGRIFHIETRHIEGGRLTSYTGNYSQFEVEHAAAQERTAALADKQQREVARVQSFVDRFRAQATKARQVQSRLKWLARLGEIAPAHMEEDFRWEFTAPAKLPRPLVDLEDLSAGYGDRVVIGGVSMSIHPGDRIGVLGRNGAGKSTFMKVLAGQNPPLAGKATFAPDIVTGFFAQMELEHLDAEGTPMSELGRRGAPFVDGWTEQQRRDHLGRFGFRGDRVFEACSTFSGGERARLAFSILVARRPNLLLLDEPTNHLDFEMRHALLMALQDYAGAVVVVSHDRALLRGACDRFLLVANGEVKPFDGDLEDYASWLRSSESAAQGGRMSSPGAADAGGNAGISGGAGASASALQSATARRDQRRAEAEARNRLAPLRAELRDVEKRLAELGAKRARLEKDLGDPDFYAARSPEEQRRTSADHVALGREIAALEERWLELSETLEEGGGAGVTGIR